MKFCGNQRYKTASLQDSIRFKVIFELVFKVFGRQRVKRNRM